MCRRHLSGAVNHQDVSVPSGVVSSCRRIVGGLSLEFTTARSEYRHDKSLGHYPERLFAMPTRVLRDVSLPFGRSSITRVGR